MKNQTISEIYTNDNKSKLSSNPTDILISAKKIVKNFIPKTQVPKLRLLDLLAKFLTERKYLINNFTFVRRKFSR